MQLTPAQKVTPIGDAAKKKDSRLPLYIAIAAGGVILWLLMRRK